MVIEVQPVYKTMLVLSFINFNVPNKQTSSGLTCDLSQCAIGDLVF